MGAFLRGQSPRGSLPSQGRWSSEARQKLIVPYILDFYCASARLAVELDSNQHYEDTGKAYDERRTAYLQQKGIQVLRFSNPDVMRNFDGVCMQIDLTVKKILVQNR